MLLIKKGFRRRYVYGGSGMFDSLISAITSTAAQTAAKQIAMDIGKKTVTQIGQKAANKAIDLATQAILPAKKQNALTPVSKQILESLTANGSGYKPINIQDLVKKINAKV